MYQMYAYSKKYRASDIWLLYPQTEGLKAYDNEISFSSEDEDVKTKVHVFFVDVANIEESLKELQNIISK